MSRLEIGRALLERQPFVTWLNPSLEVYENGRVEVILDIRPDLTQHHGFVFGGVLASLADIVIGGVGALCFGDIVTSEFKINFLRPAACRRVLAVGVLLKCNKRSACCEARLYALGGDDEALVAIALGTTCLLSDGRQSAPL